MSAISHHHNSPVLGAFVVFARMSTMDSTAHKKSIFCTSDFMLIVSVTVGVVFEYVYPTSLPAMRMLSVSGGLLLILVAWHIIWSAKRELRKTSQSTKPGVATTNLVTTGIFRWSRNPIYLSMVLLAHAAGLILESVWITFGSSTLCGIFIYLLLIKPEEAYLKKQFGKTYTEYKERVRRWL